MGNDGSGIVLGSGAKGVNAVNGGLIGGTDPGEGNVIAYNTGAGVDIPDLRSDVSILGNSIFANTAIGISLQRFIVVNLDPPLTAGSNGIAAAPIITNVTQMANATRAQGYLRRLRTKRTASSFSRVQPIPRLSSKVKEKHLSVSKRSRQMLAGTPILISLYRLPAWSVPQRQILPGPPPPFSRSLSPLWPVASSLAICSSGLFSVKSPASRRSYPMWSRGALARVSHLAFITGAIRLRIRVRKVERRTILQSRATRFGSLIHLLAWLRALPYAVNRWASSFRIPIHVLWRSLSTAPATFTSV